MRLVINSLLYGLSSIGNAAIPFLLLPILTRTLDPAAFGIVSLWEGVLLAMIPIVTMGVNGAVNVEYFRRADDDFRHYVASALAIPAVTAFVLIPIVGAVAAFAGQRLGISGAWLVFAVIVAMLGSYRAVLLSLWQARGQAGQFGLLQLLASLLNIGVSLWLVAYLALGWSGRAFGIAAGIGLSGLFSIVLLVKQFPVRNGIRRVHIREALALGAPLVPHGIAMMVILYVDRALLSAFIDLDAVGIYVAAFQVAAAITVIANAMNQAWTPRMFELLSARDGSGDKAAVRTAASYMALLTVACIVLLLSADSLFGLLVGVEFHGANRFVPVLAVSFLISGVYKPFVNVIFFERRTDTLMYIAFATTTTAVLANLVLIPRFGIAGAAAASVISNLFLLVSTIVVAQKIRALPWLRAWLHSPTKE